MSISMAPASLRARAAAFGLDYLVIAAYLIVVGRGGRPASRDSARFIGCPVRQPAIGELIGFMVLTLPVTLYFALSERSAAGGTWGKRRMRLRVVTDDGRRLSLGRSLARSGLKFVPWELSHAIIWQFSAAGADPPAILNVGLVGVWVLIGLNLLSALLDQRRRARYDRMARTVVVVNEQRPVS